MSLIKTSLEKAVGALEICTRRLADFESERAAKAAQVDETTDFDEGFALREELAVIARKIESATVARDHAAGQVDRAKAEAAEAEADRRHATAQKIARAGEKLTLDVVAAAERLADALAALEANRAEVDAANEVRGSRAFVVDGEARLRQIPAREVPAVTRREMAWINAKGERPMNLIMRNGELVPAGMSGDYVFREVEVVESLARFEPARMPVRLSDAIELVGLRGERLWPRP